MNFDMSFHIDIKELLHIRAKELHRTAALNMLNMHYNDGRNGRPKGIGFDLVEKQIDDLILSDSANAYISKLIEEEWQNTLRDATLKAMQHRANKLAFSKVDEMNSEEPVVKVKMARLKSY